MIYINKTEQISVEEMKEILLKLDLNKKLENAKTIAIKPNFAAGTYVDSKSHVVSNLSFLSNIISCIYSLNKKAIIYIAESDSTGYGFAYEKFNHLGIPEKLNISKDVKNRIKLLDLSRDKLTRSESKNFKRYTSVDRQLWLSNTFMNCDFIINISNLKTHSVTGYTGACKNLFGCLPDFEKYHNHPYIHEVVHDLVLAINPTLNIVDAFYGMEKNGPVQGIPINSGYRVISNNALEADVYASSTVGLNPRKIKYIKLLGKTQNIKTTKNAETIKKYKKPGLFLRIMNSIGLFIQKIGLKVENFGHRIHTSSTPLILLITIFRPILLKLFNYEKLRKLKKKMMKK